jgi:hypothetical protein
MVTVKIEEITKYVGTTKTKKTIYQCSDGKQFGSDSSSEKGVEFAKKCAEEYETRLEIKNQAKTQLNFYSISSQSEYNNGFEPEFCFYYSPDLSEFAKSWLKELIYDADLSDFVEGWYHVEQKVCTDAWDSQVDVCLLSELIEHQERKLNAYKSIQEELKSR